MLTVVLRILSILGMLFLGLLLLAVIMLLLVLFYPITYHVSGAKDTEGFRISAKVKWLLGLVRVRYGYPEPGEFTAKILIFTIFRTKIPPDKTESPSSMEKGHSIEEKHSDEKKTFRNKDNADIVDCAEQNNSASSIIENVSEGPSGSSREKMPKVEKSEDSAFFGEKDYTEEKNSGFGKILQKLKKIKYTIHSLYDKIKEIWNNISYYLELLQEEETRQVLAHIRFRMGKMIKSVWPGRIKADIRFGADSPDTTGYLYGVYCMFSPMLGKGLCVTPDFERKVLEAEFDIAGHITVWVLAVNACKIALDKRLWRLIKKAAAPIKQPAQKKAA